MVFVQILCSRACRNLHFLRMAEGGPLASNLELFKQENKSAFVTGYTGAIGKLLVQELEKVKMFKRVVLIGRREVDLSVGPEFEQKVVDYDKLDDYADLFKDLDVGFNCLGTTHSQVGTETHIKVDHDYFLKIAELAKNQSCKHLLMISAMGANAKSSTTWRKIKGGIEEEAKQLDFNRLSIYRPGALLGGKTENWKEKASKVVFKPIFWISPTTLSVPRETVAKAMIADALCPTKEEYKVRLFANKDIHAMAKEYPA